MWRGLLSGWHVPGVVAVSLCEPLTCGLLSLMAPSLGLTHSFTGCLQAPYPNVLAMSPWLSPCFSPMLVLGPGVLHIQNPTVTLTSELSHHHLEPTVSMDGSACSGPFL